MDGVTVIDACGRACPEPVLMTKKALEGGRALIQVRVDNPAALGNVTRFAQNQGYSVTVGEEGEVFCLTLKKR